MLESTLPSNSPRANALETEELHAWFGTTEIVKGVSLALPAKAVTAIIGPSGCGKSTFLRCLNRMHEVTPGARVSGKVLLGGMDLYGAGMDPVAIRRRIGMVFQRPNPFPAMSIRENVLAGLTLNKLAPKGAEADALVESILRQTALWDEVKDGLKRSGASLSGGQQQRLCIARALALDPEVLLLDEPCSALDPIATAKIEELIREIGQKTTIIMVTHNMQQAARISSMTAFFYMGELIEFGETTALFTTPKSTKTEDYITGRFG